MTDDELDTIVRDSELGYGSHDDVLALVAEVRRLRGRLNMNVGTGPVGAFRDDSGPRMR